MNISLVCRFAGRAVRAKAFTLVGALIGLAGGPAFAQIVHEGETFQVIDPSQVPNLMSELGPGETLVEGPGLGPHSGEGLYGKSDAHGGADLYDFGGSCRSCGGGSCGAGSCRRGRGHAGSGHAGFANPGFGGGMTGMSCEPFWYATTEALYLRRFGDEDFTVARQFSLDDFGYEWAPRLTVGTVPDCVNGFEASFTGSLNWDMRDQAVDAGNLETLLVPSGVSVEAEDLDSFNGADSQSQSYGADYWSIEANRTFNGWGVAKYLYGARYVEYDEDFVYASTHAANGSGLFRSSTENRMIGAQIGLDLLYPVARFAYVDLRGRAGGFLNLAESRIDLVNNGEAVISRSSRDEELSGIFEFGTGLRYELGESLSIRGGMEAWYVTRVATARGQIRNPVSTAMGRKVDRGDDFFVFGLNAGAEFKY